MNAEDIKVGQRWRSKWAPEYSVGVVKTTQRSVYYRSQPDAVEHQRPLGEWLRDWEPVDASR